VIFLFGTAKTGWAGICDIGCSSGVSDVGDEASGD